MLFLHIIVWVCFFQYFFFHILIVACIIIEFRFNYFLADGFSASLLLIKLSVQFAKCIYHLPFSTFLGLVGTVWIVHVFYQFYFGEIFRFNFSLLAAGLIPSAYSINILYPTFFRLNLQKR